MSRKGEKGLTDPQIERKEELVKELKIRFEYAQAAIDKYNATLFEANKFISEMRKIFEIYYKSREDDWEHEDSYNEFLREWQDIEVNKIEIEDYSIPIQDLTEKVVRF